jgi:hypothetical protein
MVATAVQVAALLVDSAASSVDADHTDPVVCRNGHPADWDTAVKYGMHWEHVQGWDALGVSYQGCYCSAWQIGLQATSWSRGSYIFLQHCTIILPHHNPQKNVI